MREAPPNRRRTVRELLTVDEDLTHFAVYVEAGFYDDGRLAEVFLTSGKKGAVIRDLLDGWAVTLSIAIQHGVPLPEFGSDNELTGRSGRLLPAILAKIKELTDAQVRGGGDAVPSATEAGDQRPLDPEIGDPSPAPHP